jgi:hypothetical protein
MWTTGGPDAGFQAIEILRLSLIVEMGHDILATDEKHPARPFGNRHQLGRNHPIRCRPAFYLTILGLRRHMSKREREQYPTCRTQFSPPAIS